MVAKQDQSNGTDSGFLCRNPATATGTSARADTVGMVGLMPNSAQGTGWNSNIYKNIPWL